MKRDDVYYEAMKARDYRFDGKFFVGVKTTGIYCRPICPAKPKKENVEFFPNHLAAERAGYRPCLRCRPESAPQSAVWIGKSAIVRRAIKMISHLESLDFNEEGFAGLFGVSARHLRRIFAEEIGKTPKQLCFENRLNLARKFIVETTLPITEIAFASGFHSVRRFNDAFKDRFTTSPSDVRRKAPAKGGGIKLSLSYRPPFDFVGLMRSYEAHRMGKLEWFENNRMHRVVEFGGKVGIIMVSNDPENSRLWVDIDFPDTKMLHAIVSRVRHLFDLDSDPLVVANSLRRDPKIKNLLKKHAGIRLPSGWDSFEVAIGIILGQFVSVDCGRILVENLIDLLGSESGFKRGGTSVKLFPTPKQIASADLNDLKTTGAKKQTLIAFSKMVAEGSLSLEATQDVDKFLKKVIAVKGIGEWTANYMALKVLRYTDAFPETDLVLSRTLKFHSQEAIAQMRPWRGYVAALFWREYHERLK
jgi:AraC family transcriptional regulator of adaptative response / DNA-3-methyladenine glycosylase II